MKSFQFAMVGVMLVTSSTMAVSVAVDINDIGAAGNTQAGFESVTLNDGGVGAASKTLSNGVTIDIDAAGFAFVDSDRVRATPVNSGGLTQAALYQDFIFAAQDTNAATATTRGLDVKLGNLSPGVYDVTIHSFDSGSAGTRTSDWSVSNAPTVAVDNYTFNGNTLPTNDTDNQFTFTATVGLNGNLTIQGRQDAANTAPQVFLNAIQLKQTALLTGADVLAVDINSGNSPTENGFVGLTPAAGSGNGSNVVVNGTTFEVFSSDGHRDRGAAVGTDLTRDFIFDDGNNAAVGLRVFDLPSGLWQAEVFSNEDTVFPVGDQFVGISQLGGTTSIDGNTIPNAELIFTDEFGISPTDPFTFIFDTSQVANGFGIFTRENNAQNRSRFNGLRLTRLVPAVPEPATGLLALMGLAGLAKRRRRAA